MSFEYNPLYTGLDVNEVKLLAFLIDKGLDQNFMRELFKIEEINWFLNFVKYKRIDKLIGWINEKYIETDLQNLALDLYKDHDLEYHLDHSDYCYFGYVQWLVKHYTADQIYDLIENEIELSEKYNYENYIVARDIIDIIRNSDIHEFESTLSNDEDAEDILINRMNKMAVSEEDTRSNEVAEGDDYMEADAYMNYDYEATV